MSTSLYRFFGKDGRLLYVGISLSLAARLSKHSERPWFGIVKSISVEHYESRDEAARREIVAIQNELPLFNVLHQPRVCDANEFCSVRDAWKAVADYFPTPKALRYELTKSPRSRNYEWRGVVTYAGPNVKVHKRSIRKTVEMENPDRFNTAGAPLPHF